MQGYFITDDDFDGIWLWFEEVIKAVGNACEGDEFTPADFKAEMLRSMRRTRVRVEGRLKQCILQNDSNSSPLDDYYRSLQPAEHAFGRGDIGKMIDKADTQLFNESLEDPDWDELDEGVTP